MDKKLKIYLDQKVDQFNQTSFIENDPISVPHKYSKKQDIEIAGFFAAIFSWGLRKTIINKSNELTLRMDNDPHQFILHHTSKDLERLEGFKHRTFNDLDAIGFVNSLKNIYSKYASLEECFCTGYEMEANGVFGGINYMSDLIFSHEEILDRSKKHFPKPANHSACKRFNMFLRWMVRKDNKGVDFGIWKKVNQKDLIIPLDVNVIRVAQKLGLLDSEKSDWKNAIKLTTALREFDALDPVKYDYALFGLGIEQKSIVFNVDNRL